MALATFEATDGDAQTVSRVRAFVTAELGRIGRDDISDAALLVVSELATNAVLHAGGITAVHVDATHDGVRLEVHDRGRVAPIMPLSSHEAMTGRGLRLVRAISERWAAEPTPEGKMVWAEVTRASASLPPLVDPTPADLWSDDAWTVEGRPRQRHRVTLGDVPTSLLVAAKSHVDNIVREFALASRGAASGVTGDLPPHLASLIETVATRFAEARREIKRQAVSAALRGQSHVRLELELPADAADAGDDYLKALDLADSYCRAARLLTLESPPQHRVFRRWYVGELVAQLRAAAAGLRPPPHETFEDRLLSEVDTSAKAQQASERAARLYQVSAALARAATPEAVAKAVLEQGVAALSASGGGMLLATDADRLALPATVGYDDDVVQRLRSESKDAELPAAVALRTGEPVWLETRQDRDQRFPELINLERGTVSACAVPLVVGDRRLGALRFSFPQPRLFDEDERRFVEALAAQTAQALNRTQLNEQRLAFSRRLQRSLLPSRLAAPPQVEMAGVYRSLGDGTDLGGDIYDVWPMDPGLWGLTIADAAGTGPEAAALTAMVRFTLRGLTVADTEPVSVLANLNRALRVAGASGHDEERFCTALFGVLRAGPPWTVTLAGGGHPPPVLKRANGTVEEIAVGGTLLGVFEDAPIASSSVTLEPGDTLVLYTDGAVEARRDDAMFGSEGLLAAVAGAAPGAAAVADAIESAVLEHTGGIVSDDLAALVVYVMP